MSKNDQHVLNGRTAGFVTRMFAFVIDIGVVAGIVAVGGWIAVLVDDTIEQVGFDPNLDLATIYGAANPELTAQMIDRVFSANPKYGTDLADAVTQVRTLSAPCFLLRRAPSLACWPFGSSLS